MSEIISSNEINYKKRRIAISVSELVDSIPVIVITGARQVGKSTMLRNEFADYDYIASIICSKVMSRSAFSSAFF